MFLNILCLNNKLYMFVALVVKLFKFTLKKLRNSILKYQQNLLIIFLTFCPVFDFFLSLSLSHTQARTHITPHSLAFSYKSLIIIWISFVELVPCWSRCSSKSSVSVLVSILVQRWNSPMINFISLVLVHSKTMLGECRLKTCSWCLMKFWWLPW